MERSSDDFPLGMRPIWGPRDVDSKPKDPPIPGPPGEDAAPREVPIWGPPEEQIELGMRPIWGPLEQPAALGNVQIWGPPDAKPSPAPPLETPQAEEPLWGTPDGEDPLWEMLESQASACGPPAAQQPSWEWASEAPQPCISCNDQGMTCPICHGNRGTYEYTTTEHGGSTWVSCNYCCASGRVQCTTCGKTGY